MKTLKVAFSILALIFFITPKICAQTKFEVPQHVELKVKEDYPKYSADIINATKWLEENDLDKEVEKRKQVSAFVMTWVLGCPMFDIDLTERLTKIYGKNTPLLLIYMGSYSRYFLENNTTATKFSGIKAGLISIMAVYKKDIEISKSKEMDKLIKQTGENKLDDYIKDNFKY